MTVQSVILTLAPLIKVKILLEDDIYDIRLFLNCSNKYIHCVIPIYSSSYFRNFSLWWTGDDTCSRMWHANCNLYKHSQREDGLRT